MFVRVIRNNKGDPNTFYCSLVQSYRENNVSKHRVILNFVLLDKKRIPYLKAAFSKEDPEKVLKHELCSQGKGNK